MNLPVDFRSGAFRMAASFNGHRFLKALGTSKLRPIIGP